MTRPDHAIDAYLEGPLTDVQALAIDTWIAADPANASEFLYLARTHQTLGTLGNEQRVKRQAAEIKPNQLDPVTLASLAEMEAAAETELVVLDAKPTLLFRPRTDASTTKTPRRFEVVISKAVVYGGIAAVLVLAAMLFVFQTDDMPSSYTNPSPQVAVENQDVPTEPALVPAPEGKPKQPILPPAPVAQAVGGHLAGWAEAPEDGQLHAGQTLELTSGFVELAFSRGARVLIQAPASVEPLSATRVRVRFGKLFATTEGSDAPFEVLTNNVQLIDLGTSFGVSVEPSTGTTRTFVYSGKVQAVPLDPQGRPSGESIMLVERESATAKADIGVQRGGADRFSFVTETNDAPYLVQATGNARYLGSLAVNQNTSGDLSSDQTSFVLLEKTGVSPASELTVAVTEPGLYENFIELAKPLSLDTAVDSYLVRFQTKNNQLTSVTGRIKFPRPVLAMMTSTAQRIATDPLFALPDSELSFQDGSGLEPYLLKHLSNDVNDSDWIRLSKDRLTIEYQLAAQGLDEFRVLIQAAEDQP